MKYRIGLFIALQFYFFYASAIVKPNSLFSNNGVLQQGVAIPIWGTAALNEKVTVEFGNQKIITTAINGKWMVKLEPLKSSRIPMNMTITGENVVTIKNILVGEVWLCSGQSNMAFPLRAVVPKGDYKTVDQLLIEAQNFSQIRQFSIPLLKSTKTPLTIDDVNGKWLICDSNNAKNFSAVAYFFGRELFQKLQVPIGLINSSYGGTAIENWISEDELNTFPELKSIFTNYEKALNAFPKNLEEYKKNEPKLVDQFKKDSAIAASLHKEIPRKPSLPMSPAERGGPTGLWNTMISPLIPYAFKGCLWYQGEANASRGLQYRTLLPALINSWRKKWDMGNFPFIIIQIPGWKNHSPELREAQLFTTQNTANTSMTVITDCDDTLNVHPGNKEPVGIRASLQARAIAYGEKLEYVGPIFKSMKIKGNQAILNFIHTGKGLVAQNGDLQDFVIAGEDKKFIPGKAIIKNNRVIVSADGIKKPVAVRMGWRLCPQVNLYNKEGLCASSFRTDPD